MASDHIWENPVYKKVKWKIIGWTLLVFSLFIGSVVLSQYVHYDFFYLAVLIMIITIIPVRSMYIFRIKVPKKITFGPNGLHIENMEPKGIKISYQEIVSVERPSEIHMIIELKRFIHLSKRLKLSHIDNNCYDELKKRIDEYNGQD